MGDFDLFESAAGRVDRLLPGWLRQGPVADRLQGKDVGHPLHTTLTDLPIGLLASSALLDVMGRGRWRDASMVLATAGLGATVPTAISGLADWKYVDIQDRSTTVAHAWSNGMATLAFGASLAAKARRRDSAAAVCAIAGVTALAVGGFLGGHLSFARGVGGPRH